jgi:hypothetical protein
MKLLTVSKKYGRDINKEADIRIYRNSVASFLIELISFVFI